MYNKSKQIAKMKSVNAVVVFIDDMYFRGKSIEYRNTVKNHFICSPSTVPRIKMATKTIIEHKN